MMLAACPVSSRLTGWYPATSRKPRAGLIDELSSDPEVMWFLSGGDPTPREVLEYALTRSHGRPPHREGMT